MPKRTDIRKIMVIGSGPIVIGQAAEFDYSGTQACLSLKEEGYQVVLVNSNPATIMTDKDIADKVYIEPITLEFVTRILRKERPDALLPTLGGQTGLNMAMALSKNGILEELNVELLGTKLSAIDKAEDRDLFKQLMEELNQPIPESEIVNSVEEAIQFAEQIGYPLIVRPAFTLGGTGGGMCDNQEQLVDITTKGLKLSPVTQCLIERSIAGFKEIEYEVMRDAADNALVVCNMENFDPVGIHTGDSIVFAPAQTLSDVENQLLRDASLDIIRALKIEGGCNVQLALDPNSFKYYVIEVNPRVSRSSALASKATGYPIAKLAAKIAVGLTLDEVINPITKTTYAMFEPALDYVVAKMPRFPAATLQGTAYSNAKSYATGTLTPMLQGMILFSETLSEKCTELQTLYVSICGDEDLDSVVLESKLASDRASLKIAEALLEHLNDDPEPSKSAISSTKSNIKKLKKRIKSNQKKLDNLNEFNAHSATVFADISNAQSTVNQALAAVSTGFSGYNSKTGAFGKPTSGQMEWTKTVKKNWKEREDAKAEELKSKKAEESKKASKIENTTKKSNVSVDKKKLIKAANEAYKLGEIKKDTYESIISGLSNASAALLKEVAKSKLTDTARLLM